MPNASPSLNHVWRSLGGWPRRALAVLLLLVGGAALLTQPSRSTPSRQTVGVVVAATEVSAGTALTASDLRLVGWPATVAPNGAAHTVAELLGRSVAVALWPGEPVTRHRLLTVAIDSQLVPGQVAMTITLLGSAVAALLRPGARIDLYPSDDRGGASGPAAVATNVAVLAVLTPDTTGATPTDPTGLGSRMGSDSATDQPPSIVIACDRAAAARVAEHVSAPLVATLRPTQ